MGTLKVMLLAPLVILRFLFWYVPRDYLRSKANKKFSQFLVGSFAPVSQELSFKELPVEGSIPGDLDGCYVRNGPNPLLPQPGNHHWFDGDGMLHMVELRPGAAPVYANRWTRTARFLEEQKTGKPPSRVISAILTCHGILRMLLPSVWDGILARFQGDRRHPVHRGLEQNFQQGSANTNVEFHAGRFLALVESDYPYQVSLPQLETLRRYNYDGALKHPMTAHPKVDPRTGELIFFSYSPAPVPPAVFHAVVDAKGTLIRSVGVNLEKPVMMHDFAVTEKYSILLDLPLTFDMKRPILHGRPIIEFEPDRRSRFGLLPRHATSDSEIRWFTTGACYIFHVVNAWEEGQTVVLVACRAAFTSVLDLNYMNNGEMEKDLIAKSRISLHRWEFDLRTGTTHEKALDKTFAEFPVIHPGLVGVRNRFAYCALFAEQTTSLTLQAIGLVKYDLETGQHQQLLYASGEEGGEAVFVPREGGNNKALSEDDGYLLVFVYEPATVKSETTAVAGGRSSFRVYDAKTFSTKPIARVLLPARVPHGFHGKWVPQTQILTQRL
jgi:carotenoid cleavage dioxygenase